MRGRVTIPLHVSSKAAPRHSYRSWPGKRYRCRTFPWGPPLPASVRPPSRRIKFSCALHGYINLFSRRQRLIAHRQAACDLKASGARGGAFSGSLKQRKCTRSYFLGAMRFRFAASSPPSMAAACCTGMPAATSCRCILAALACIVWACRCT